MAQVVFNGALSSFLLAKGLGEGVDLLFIVCLCHDVYPCFCIEHTMVSSQKACAETASPQAEQARKKGMAAGVIPFPLSV